MALHERWWRRTSAPRRPSTSATQCNKARKDSDVETHRREHVYALWNSRPVRIAKERRHVFETLRREHEIGKFYTCRKLQNVVKFLKVNTSSIFTARCYASVILAMGLCPCLSVCLCLCLSVTSRCSTKTAKRRITQTTPHDTPGTLVFWRQRYPRNLTEVTPYGGAKCRWGGSKSSTFD